MHSVPSGFSWETGVSVDLGAGRFPRNPLRARRLVAVDVLDEAAFVENSNVEYVRTIPGEQLQFDDEQVDCCTGYDFLEHVPRFDRLTDGRAVNPFIEMMNEIYRILRPGGVLIAVTPSFPREAAFTDPTHVNPITPGTHEYFSGHVHARQLGYGFNGDFNCLAAEWIFTDDPVWDCIDTGEREPSPDPLSGSGARTSRRGQITDRFRHSRFSPETPFHFLWVLQKRLAAP